MKVRKGFVSNSSSSSFIIGVKDAEFTVENLSKLLGSQQGPLKNVIDEIAKFLVTNSKQVSIDELFEDYSIDSNEDLESAPISVKKVVQAIRDGFTVFKGWASNEDYGIELIVYSLELSYRDENLILESFN